MHSVNRFGFFDPIITLLPSKTQWWTIWAINFDIFIYIRIEHMPSQLLWNIQSTSVRTVTAIIIWYNSVWHHESINFNRMYYISCFSIKLRKMKRTTSIESIRGSKTQFVVDKIRKQKFCEKHQTDSLPNLKWQVTPCYVLISQFKLEAGVIKSFFSQWSGFLSVVFLRKWPGIKVQFVSELHQVII